MPDMSNPLDPRLHTSLTHLRGLSRAARAVSFLPSQPARSALNGRHASRLRGRGLNFEELRNYQIGDDPRTIDWKVTARTGEPYVRVYTEERDRPALLVVDQRVSMFFGTERNMKSVTAAEAAAIAAFRIRAQGDRVGGIVFSDDRVSELRPKASGVALNRLISTIAEANCALNVDIDVATAMPLNRPLRAASRVATTGNLILVFSDFSEVDDTTEKLVRRMSQHNDVILFAVTDTAQIKVPVGDRMVVSDGTLQAELELNQRSVSARIEEVMGSRVERALSWTRKYGIPVLPLTASRETLPQMREMMGHAGGPR